MFHLYFNSIKVQLELYNLYRPTIAQHNFNSIKVQLELKLSFATVVKQYFNSIKVQLELLIASIVFFSDLFQFHKGTIRTPAFAYLRHRLRISIP